MYSSIFGVLTSPFMVLIYFYILKIPNLLRNYDLSMKPFNCGFCMTFWICFLYEITKNNLVDALFISSISPFIYIYIEDKFLEKWNP